MVSQIPAIAFGSGSVNKGKDIHHYVSQAIDSGFSHLDTAQCRFTALLIIDVFPLIALIIHGQSIKTRNTLALPFGSQDCQGLSCMLLRNTGLGVSKTLSMRVLPRYGEQSH